MPDTALHTAIRKTRSLVEIEAILTRDSKIDINAVDDQQKTALTLAVATEQYDVAMYLFRHQASVAAAFLPSHESYEPDKIASILNWWFEPWIKWGMEQLEIAEPAKKFALHQELFNLWKELNNCLLTLAGKEVNCLTFCKFIIETYSESMKPPFANNAEYEAYLKNQHELLQETLLLNATRKYFNGSRLEDILDSFFLADLEKMLAEKCYTAKLATVMQFYQHCDRYNWEDDYDFVRHEESIFTVRNLIFKGILLCYEAGKLDKDKQAPTTEIMAFDVTKAYVNRTRNYPTTENYKHRMADLNTAQHIFATIPPANRPVVECPLRNLLDFDAKNFSWHTLLGNTNTVTHFNQADIYERLRATLPADDKNTEILWQLINYDYEQSISSLEQTINDFWQILTYKDRTSFVRLQQQRQLLLARQRENYANFLYNSNPYSYKVTLAWRASALIALMQSLRTFETNIYGFDHQLKAISANIKRHAHSASDEDCLLIKLVDFINYIVEKLAHSERYILRAQEDIKFTSQYSYISNGLIRLQGIRPSDNLQVYQQLLISVQNFLAEKKAAATQHPEDFSDDTSEEESDDEKQESARFPRSLGKSVKSPGSALSIRSSEFHDNTQSLSSNRYRTNFNAGSPEAVRPNPTNPPAGDPPASNPYNEPLLKKPRLGR